MNPEELAAELAAINTLHPTLWRHKSSFNEEDLEVLDRLVREGKVVRYRDHYRRVWRIPEEELENDI